MYDIIRQGVNTVCLMVYYFEMACLLLSHPRKYVLDYWCVVCVCGGGEREKGRERE